MQYVGQTTKSLADRINNHLSCIRTHKHTPISLHFNMPKHSLNDFRIHAIEQITSKNNITELLNTKETYWQNTLQTVYPLGINCSNINYM